MITESNSLPFRCSSSTILNASPLAGRKGQGVVLHTYYLEPCRLRVEHCEFKVTLSCVGMVCLKTEDMKGELYVLLEQFLKSRCRPALGQADFTVPLKSHSQQSSRVVRVLV